MFHTTISGKNLEYLISPHCIHPLVFCDIRKCVFLKQYNSTEYVMISFTWYWKKIQKAQTFRCTAVSNFCGW